VQLKKQSEEWRAMKLVTLGHGRIGKTTLLNKLRSILDPNEKFDVSTLMLCDVVLQLLIECTESQRH
jgi:hypothetical protein